MHAARAESGTSALQPVGLQLSFARCFSFSSLLNSFQRQRRTLPRLRAFYTADEDSRQTLRRLRAFYTADGDSRQAEQMRQQHQADPPPPPPPTSPDGARLPYHCAPPGAGSCKLHFGFVASPLLPSLYAYAHFLSSLFLRSPLGYPMLCSTISITRLLDAWSSFLPSWSIFGICSCTSVRPSP